MKYFIVWLLGFLFCVFGQRKKVNRSKHVQYSIMSQYLSPISTNPRHFSITQVNFVIKSVHQLVKQCQSGIGNSL